MLFLTLLRISKESLFIFLSLKGTLFYNNNGFKEEEFSHFNSDIHTLYR